MIRADLARTLIQEPEFLVLDEPTAHLDITHQASRFLTSSKGCICATCWAG